MWTSCDVICRIEEREVVDIRSAVEQEQVTRWNTGVVTDIAASCWQQLGKRWFTRQQSSRTKVEAAAK